MALRNQPYLPLYVQDLLTDEKLILCSAESHGIYLRLMCILHKQEVYGKLYIKQKYKQNESKFVNFATFLCLQMPFSQKQILDSLIELNEEGVITITDDELYQKRMVYDGELSLTRAKVGKTGGSSVTKQYGKAGYLYLMSDGFDKTKIGISVNPQNRLYRLRSDLNLPKHFQIIHQVSVRDMGSSEDLIHEYFKDIRDGEWLVGDFKDIEKRFVLFKAKIKANGKAKVQANTENENENENENIIKDDNIIYAENVKMKKSEFEKLNADYGAEDTKTMIQILDNYKGANGKKYKSDYRAILNWVVNRLKDEKTRNNGTNKKSFTKRDEVHRLAAEAAAGIKDRATGS